MVLHYNKKEDCYKELKLYAKAEDLPYGDNKEEFLPVYPPYEDRCYALFGKLAGVRVMEEPMVPLRGLFHKLPDELCEKYSEDGSYYHSATWFDMAELPLLAKERGEVEDDWYGEKYNPVQRWVQEIQNMLDYFWINNYDIPGNVIVQIWFDN